MSERLIAAAQANFGAPGMAQVVPHVALVREAVATLGWGTMIYRCDACGFEWEVWLGLGVEGPPSLKGAKLYVPSPFTLSSCPAWPIKPDATDEERSQFRHLMRCNGPMTHVDWRQDREFSPVLIPDDAPRFVLDQWHGQADLVIPEPALVRARRFHDNGENS